MRQILTALTLGAALALSASTAFAGDSELHSFPPAASTSIAQVGVPNAAMTAGSNQAVPYIVEQRGENFDHQ